MIEKTFPITEKLLDNGLKATQQLLELLNQEADYLRQKTDPLALSAIVANKREIIVQLEQFSKQLGQVLATEKLVANHDGIHDYLLKAQSAGISIDGSRNCWANITALLKKCRALNEQNGAGIDLLSRHTQRSLQILRGKSQLASTYGPDGSTRSELFSHTLISV